MEGVLYKWTNYLTGWQPRWFVLDNGILSYYDSQDDVCKGSKGSIKMAVCEIKVHPTDNTRMELIIPGEQHFYMKAVNAAERQRWLVALGSSKACLTDTRTKKEKEISETNESLKTKMSELRLYCDLLMQQVHTIQEFVHHDESRSSPSIEMKRSISHPGAYSSGSSNATKEPISSFHRLSQRRRRTYSDTESCNDIPFEDTERPAHCSRSALNGHLAPSTIPEENRSVSKKRPELEETLPSSSS
ncbi:pleckstrin homology domain-containing family A member 3 isoform X2 [Chelonoidis abingdonii]|uniref:pleckstrin homology domain-containing family A member 3 isoform X2 n=1 Tax=Chelonoidis abingdonii TaxID=106734 RepID=UPI0013F19FB5|nr:pleckstrin homology domain-containing family A member 3 isoform X2 [Chelonoidis abingdonii]